MPIILTKQINTNTLLAVWEITETTDYFLSKLILDKTESDIFKNFKSDFRRKHWLSYRLLIKELLNLKINLNISYDKYNRPYFTNSSLNLSVSHSGKYSAVIISKTQKTGIDIEKIHIRIKRITDKFMSKEEQNQIKHSDKLEYLYIYWCAKEALYKLFEKKNIIFKKNIIISPFIYKETGFIKGKIKINDFEQIYTLSYKKIDDYMLVYVVN